MNPLTRSWPTTIVICCSDCIYLKFSQSATCMSAWIWASSGLATTNRMIYPSQESWAWWKGTRRRTPNKPLSRRIGKQIRAFRNGISVRVFSTEKPCWKSLIRFIRSSPQNARRQQQRVLIDVHLTMKASHLTKCKQYLPKCRPAILNSIILVTWNDQICSAKARKKLQRKNKNNIIAKVLGRSRIVCY